MTREEFDYIDDRLEYLTVNSDLIGSNITQMDCLISIANEYSKEHYDNKRRVCKNCKHYNMDTAVYYCDTYDIVMINSDHTIRSVDEDFGCNKFEHKLESK